jgi:hypothetical protein
VQQRGDGHDDVVPGEGLLPGQAAAWGEQLVAYAVEHFHAGRLVGETGKLDSGGEVDRRVTGAGQLVPPPAHQVLHPLVGLAVARGPSRDGTGLVGGIRPDGFVDLGRPGGVDLPRLSWDAGDGPTSQAT